MIDGRISGHSIQILLVGIHFRPGVGKMGEGGWVHGSLGKEVGE